MSYAQLKKEVSKGVPSSWKCVFYESLSNAMACCTAPIPDKDGRSGDAARHAEGGDTILSNTNRGWEVSICESRSSELRKRILRRSTKPL